MADLDAMLEGVRLAVDRFVFECVLTDRHDRAHGQGLWDFAEIVEAFVEWTKAWQVPESHPLMRWPIDQNCCFVDPRMFTALAEHFLLKFAGRMVRRFDAATGRTRLLVNMELREECRVHGRRDAAPTVRLVDSDFVDTSEADMVAGLVPLVLDRTIRLDMRVGGLADGYLRVSLDFVGSLISSLVGGIAPTLKDDIVVRLVASDGQPTTITLKPPYANSHTSEADMAAARGC